MRIPLLSCTALLLAASSIPASATVFATVRGVVHDPQHRPVASAQITLSAAGSAFALRSTTSAAGEFEFQNVPMGLYRLQVVAPGFAESAQPIQVVSGTNPILHIPLELASDAQSVIVRSTSSEIGDDSATPTTLVSEAEIDQTPGATRTLGMQMITDYVPGAYMTHDMLHMRGGHQTSWLIDGVAIPSTRIDSNVGPQIDPKDIDELETQRGSYAADVGDRTYGVFNVLPRNGFERNREGEWLLSAGNFDYGESQVSLGDHSARTAWYASAAGSRADYGLATPIAEIHHDATSSESGFVSLLRNQTAKDQLRLDAQLRHDFFQIPYDPHIDDWEQASNYYRSSGLRDRQSERDAFAILNWVHTLSPKALFEMAPFYHFNGADYDSLSTDTPVATTWHQSSNYAGAQGNLRVEQGRNNFAAGFYSFFQHESDLFGLVVNDPAYTDGSVPNTGANADAGLVELSFSDQLHLFQIVTLSGGMRVSDNHSGLHEFAAYPRLGATVAIPRLHWVFRGFYGHFFQPAPVQTVSPALLNYVHAQSGQNAFIPLPSERDEEHQFGVQIPWRGWVVDIDTFKNRVNNFLDHANVGESNIFIPIAVDGALVRAWELSVRSPKLAHFGSLHLAYSNQIAEQRGNVTGGFTCSDPNDPACNLGPNYTPVDHDQRHTLNTGFTAQLPRHTWFATNVSYGSGFTNGLADTGQGPYNGQYLPVHTTFDASAGRDFSEHLKISVNALNVTNHRVLLDNSITVGGFHFNDPRMISAELRWRFHF